ncbi:MAG: hypothetical protein ACR2QT_05175 [Woeseiaceae bacterium]
MTDERLNDEDVSARYREVANETTPTYLDDKIMRMAANKAEHPQYSRSVSWTRPLAWAATIALCLAITLEVSRGPDLAPVVSEPAISGRADAAMDMLEAEAPAPARNVAPQKIEQAKTQPAAGPADEASIGNSLDKRVADEPRLAEPQAVEPQATTRERRANGPVERDEVEEAFASAPLEFEVKDADVMRRVEDLASIKNGTNNEPLPEEISVTASSALAVPGRCPDQAKEDPESWMACIDALKEAGDSEAALREEEALIAVYPDFKVP